MCNICFVVSRLDIISIMEKVAPMNKLVACLSMNNLNNVALKTNVQIHYVNSSTKEKKPMKQILTISKKLLNPLKMIIMMTQILTLMNLNVMFVVPYLKLMMNLQNIKQLEHVALYVSPVVLYLSLKFI